MTVGVIWAQEAVVLVSGATEPPRLVAGDPKLADTPACPASTFKIVLAWAGLEHGCLSSTTRLVCRDPHLASQPLSLDLHEALFRSSNDFFRQTAPATGWEAITEAVRRAGLASGPALACWLGPPPMGNRGRTPRIPPPLKDHEKALETASSTGTRGGSYGLADWRDPVWRDPVWEPVVKGGELLVTPRAQHAFLQRLVRGELATGTVLTDLANALEWPSERAGLRLHGKTGAYARAVWFAGWGCEGAETKVVTVFLRGPIRLRQQAIARFYREFGLPPPVTGRATRREKPQTQP